MSWTGSPPSGPIRYSCELPDWLLRKNTPLPSGANAGELTFHPSGVSRTGGAESRACRFSIHRELVALPVSMSTSRLAKTRNRPLDDSTGEE